MKFVLLNFHLLCFVSMAFSFLFYIVALVFSLFLGGGGYLTLYGMGVESTPPASYFADNFKTAELIRMKFSDF